MVFQSIGSFFDNAPSFSFILLTVILFLSTHPTATWNSFLRNIYPQVTLIHPKIIHIEIITAIVLIRNTKLPERHGRRRRHIERIDPMRHRDTDYIVPPSQPYRVEAPLPPSPSRWPAGVPDVKTGSAMEIESSVSAMAAVWKP